MASLEHPRLLEEAIRYIQSGNPTEGRRLLQQILAEDANFMPAWLWLASVALTRDERVAALRRVLQIDPKNETARAALQQLGESYYSSDSPSDPLAAAFAPNSPKQPFLSKQDWMIVGGAVVLMLMVVFAAYMVRGTQNEEPTPIPATKTYTPSPSFTPSMTFTPRPTSTPIIQNTLPPTWTLAPTLTPLPTYTPYPTFTPLPTRTPIQMQTSPSESLPTVEFLG